MDTFLTLFNTLLPLYALIAMGFIAGKAFGFDVKTLGGFAIYICTPAVVFNFVARLDFQPVYLSLPIITFVLFSLSAMIWFKIAGYFYKDNRANLLSICASAGNTGYFGVPIAIMLFDPHWVGVYIFALVGGTFFEATTMFYIMARGNFTVMDSLKKLARLPTPYAIVAGVIFNTSGLTVEGELATYLEYFKGAYIVMGMMLIGVALSRVPRLVIGPRFLIMTFIGKFIAWPLMAIALILLDKTFFNFMNAEIYKIFYLFSIVPPAAGITAYAAELNVRPEKAATTILLGTIVALLTIPVMLMLYDRYLM